MNNIGKVVMIFTLSILLIIGLTLGALKLNGFFAVEKANIEREVFEKTHSFNEAKEQDLLKYRLEYLQADETGKQAITSTLRMMYADYDYSMLNPTLQDFLETILYGEE